MDEEREGSWQLTALAVPMKIGKEHGKNAADWVFDGNTSEATYRKVLKGIEDGDPEVMDAYRTPCLSGEFADDYSEDDLRAELDIEPADDADEEVDAYNDAAFAAFWEELERTARYQLED